MAKEKTEPAVESSKIGTSDQIETVDDLTSCYPELVKQIKNDTVGWFANWTIEQLKERCPQLYQRIAADIQHKSKVDLSVDGFLLDMGDPFAEGTLRTFMTISKLTGLRLPYVLPYKDKATKAAIENYIIRASGAGDSERTKAAEKALAKVKK